MPTMLVLGASSAIAQAAAARFAAHGWRLFLAGRNAADLEALAERIAARTGQRPACFLFDILDDAAGMERFLDSLPCLPDAVLCAVGMLAEKSPDAEPDAELAERILQTNFNGPVRMLRLIAGRFRQRGSGLIIGISSVAGDRGRGANPLYGSAKAGLSAFLSGLRSRLAPYGVRVLTVKPGLIESRMTEGRPLPRLLIASPEHAAKDIYAAVAHHADTDYTPRWWRMVMAAVCLLPEALFKRIRR